jgi:precorrin-3B synthase
MIARRGACPALADPMPTGDGLLARLAVTRAVPLDAFSALCVAARAHGNGIVEITSRGSIQVRGLTAASAPDFAAAVDVLAIADPTDGRVIANPLAGLDPDEILDVSEIADRLREILIETGLAAVLAPKVSVVIDSGGALHLDAIPADVRLRAKETRNGVCFELTLADDNAVDTVTPEYAVKVATELLMTIAAQGPRARGRDIAVTLRCETDEVGRASKGGSTLACCHPSRLGAARRAPQDDGVKFRASIEPIGTHPLRDGTVALGIGFPFGHSDAATLLNLIEEARRAEAASVRPAPGRVLLIIGLVRAQAFRLTAAAQQLGFIVTANDPRRRVVACAGAPVCAAAEISTRALAPVIAAAAHLDQQTTIHMSGCAKGCAHPGPATLTIVGVNGKCGIVHRGPARDATAELVDVDDLPAYVGRLAMQEADRG